MNFPTSGLQQRTILVVEDEPDLRALVCEILSDEFPTARVIGASCGRQALTMLNARPHLLLLDHELDGSMSGIDIYDALHSDSAADRIPTIMISGDPPLAALAARHIPNLLKPFELDVLLERVAVILSGIPRATLAGSC